jgi:hypothetical protein
MDEEFAVVVLAVRVALEALERREPSEANLRAVLIRDKENR